MALSAGEALRYSRQTVWPELGPEGQEKLKKSRAAIVGAGGLGSPAALYLAGAGVGHIRLIDGDAVSADNLQRQVLYEDAQTGKAKAECAAKRLAALNPAIKAEAVPEFFTAENAARLLSDCDVVLDCTDKFSVRYEINRACRALKLPFVHGAVYRLEGEAAVFLPDGACYECLYPSAQDDAALSSKVSGILGPVPGVIGSVQALETIKLLAGVKGGLAGRLMRIDLRDYDTAVMDIPKRAGCPVCGGGR